MRQVSSFLGSGFIFVCFFFFNDTATPEIYTLSLHDALPIEAERHQLLRGWSDTASDFPREATVHGLFIGQAEARPEAVAVEMGEERLTYRELRELAGRFARRLAALGLRP